MRVDGFRRVQALQRLGRDTAVVEAAAGDLAQALLGVLARNHARSWAALEEALLLREIVQQQGLSQHEVARRCGRDVSWVSRRLALVCALPDEALVAVRRGTISTWAAARVLAPLARANSQHATGLLAALTASPLSTRALATWFEHYQTTARAKRDRMVAHPKLFIDALQAQTDQQADARLRDGPEGACETDVRQLTAIAARLQQRLAAFPPEQLGSALLDALARLSRALAALNHDLARYHHDTEPDPGRHPHVARTGPEPASDRAAAEALT